MTRRPPRTPRPDPEHLTPEGQRYARALEAETVRDLLRFPARRRPARAGDPDERRQRRPQQAGGRD